VRNRFDVVVIGGGPAGSVTARTIAAAGYSVAVIEKQQFPRETVCGEFLSSEGIRVIDGLGLDRQFRALGPNPLRNFTLLAGTGDAVRVPLGFDACGVKRDDFDALLLAAAGAIGVSVVQPAEVTSVERFRHSYRVTCRGGRTNVSFDCRWVIGAYGRSAALDRTVRRGTPGGRTGFVGTRFHIPEGLFGGLREDELVMALGPRMYCGIARVSDGNVTLCTLERRRHGDPPSRERLAEFLRSSPGLAAITHPRLPDRIRTLPIVRTANFDFGPRAPVTGGVLMVGDAAGMIAPLAGDGISIAMQQGQLLGRLFAERHPDPDNLQEFADSYRRASARFFSRRKWIAGHCQLVVMSQWLRPAVGPLLTMRPGLLHAIIRTTRGLVERQPFLETT